MSPARDEPRVPTKVADRLRKLYMKTYSKLTWRARPPDAVELEFIGLFSDARPGEHQLGALLLTDAAGNVRVERGAPFWFLLTLSMPKNGRYSVRRGDDYAGPFEL